MTPSTNGRNGSRSGRTGDGRFAPGNAGGPGNPYARRVAELRSAMLDAVSPEDLRAIVGRLVAQAQDGDVAAAKLLFDRLLGREPLAAAEDDPFPTHADYAARLEGLVERLEAMDAEDVDPPAEA